MKFYWIVLLLAFSAQSHAKTLIFNQTQVNLGEYLSVLEDPNSNLELEAVLSKNKSEKFILLSEGVANFGYSGSSYWLKASFDSPHAQQVLIELANPRLDTVDFYVFKDKQLIDQLNTGDQKPYSSRDFDHHNFVFPVTLERGKHYSFLMKVKSNDNLFLPITLWAETAFYQDQSLSALIYGLFYGTIAIMTIINLLIFVTIKDRKYLLLSLFLFSFGLALFSLNGLASRFLWGDWVWWSKHGLIFLEGVAICFGLLFTRSFLNTAFYSPRSDKYLSLSIIISAITSLLALIIDYRWSVLIMSLLSLIIPIITITAAYICWKRNYRPARYFLIAWTIFIVGTVSYGLMLQQMLPSNVITQYGMHGGLMWLAVLLSLALTDRVNHLKQQKEQAQQETIGQQQITLNYQKRMMDSISRFVPTQFLKLLEKVDITDVHYGDAILKSMFIMFTDIRSFTSLSEMMTPEENLSFLNSYMAFMEPVVEKNQGFIDKFIGDAIMALFPNKADDALQAAIEMQQQLHLFNSLNPDQSSIKIGIGLHGGDVMLGTVGSDTRLETTVIGDAVNLTSRLENLTKELQVAIIISEKLFVALQQPELFNIQPLDAVSIRGKREKVKIYQVIV